MKRIKESFWVKRIFEIKNSRLQWECFRAFFNSKCSMRKLVFISIQDFLWIDFFQQQQWGFLFWGWVHFFWKGVEKQKVDHKELSCEIFPQNFLKECLRWFPQHQSTKYFLIFFKRFSQRHVKNSEILRNKFHKVWLGEFPFFFQSLENLENSWNHSALKGIVKRPQVLKEKKKKWKIFLLKWDGFLLANPIENKWQK